MLETNESFDDKMLSCDFLIADHRLLAELARRANVDESSSCMVSSVFFQRSYSGKDSRLEFIVVKVDAIKALEVE